MAMMSLTVDMQWNAKDKKCGDVAVAASQAKGGDGRSAQTDSRDKVTYSKESFGVSPTAKSYPTPHATRSVLGAPRGGVSNGTAVGRGPPPGLRGSPGDDYNDELKIRITI